MSDARVMGRDDGLPWRLPSDMARFKSRTVGTGDESNAVIMGRKTWQSLPDEFRPLPDRVNIVMSRDTGWRPTGCEDVEVALYPGRAIEIAFAYGCEECWVIGGRQIYDLFFDLVDEVHMTVVHDGESARSGDVLFGDLDESVWHHDDDEPITAGADDAHSSSLRVYRRRS